MGKRKEIGKNMFLSNLERKRKKFKKWNYILKIFNGSSLIFSLHKLDIFKDKFFFKSLINSNF